MSNAEFLKAVSEGDVKLVQQLLEQGADINARDYRYESNALIIAIQGYQFAKISQRPFRHYLETAELLIDFGIDVNAQNKKGDTALILASRFGFREIVEMLVEAGADLDAQEYKYGTTALMASLYRDFGIAKYLILSGANIHIKDKKGTSAIIDASGTKQKEIVSLLLERGANPNDADYSGWRPLIDASGDAEIMKLLLANGADPNFNVEDGRTPLTRECDEGYFNTSKILLEGGADANMPNSGNGMTPLMYAANATEEALQLCELLIQYGADIDAQDDNGMTPLMYSARSRQIGVMKLLIEQGADVTITDEKGKTALDHVRSKKTRKEMEKMFQEVNF